MVMHRDNILIGEMLTLSDIRFEMSVDRARNEPTKNILMRVIALVMHCWNLNKLISASLKSLYKTSR